jgi:hypothetical protein
LTPFITGLMYCSERDWRPASQAPMATLPKADTLLAAPLKSKSIIVWNGTESWRPRRTSPNLPDRPAHAARLKKAPPGLTWPSLVMPPVSSLKLAFRPEPTSVLPFTPIRVVELPWPLPSSPPEWKSALAAGTALP